MTGAYGLGPLPGTSIAEACDVILSETPLPHIPQLPDRGLGSDAIGRTASLLEGISVERGPRSWRMGARTPQVLRDQLERDLDHCEAAFGERPVMKAQVVGPWTLAALIELADGHRVLTDHGAVRDLHGAWTLGVQAHVQDIARRFGAEVTLQIDEPALPDVIAGRVPGTHTFDEIRAVPEREAVQQVKEALAGIDTSRLLINTPVWAAVIDTLLVERQAIAGTAALDALGNLLSNGHRIALAVEGEPREIAEDIAALWRELALDPVWMGEKLDLVPARVGNTLVQAARYYAAVANAADLVQRGLGDL